MKREFKIEKGIPVPRPVPMKEFVPALLRKLEVGDSFIVRRYRAGQFYLPARQLKIKVMVRAINKDEARVWRIK